MEDCRVCKKCNEEKPIKKFGSYKSSNGEKLRRFTCFICSSKSNRYENRKEYLHDHQIQWHKNNREHANYMMKEYRLKRKESGDPLKRNCETDNLRLMPRQRNELRTKVFQSKGTHCWYCKVPNANTVDHFVPLAKGGTDDLENCVPCCLSCNASKRNKMYDEWIEHLQKHKLRGLS